MEPTYNLFPDLLAEVTIPENGILSRTLFNDERVKVLVFGFATGQELTAHTAPMPAIIQILQGEARLTLGGNNTIRGKPGTLVHMAPHLEHGIYAETPVVMLLLMLKQPKTGRL
jgi:quercetin dioxygenase-like cupin family protein